MIRIPPGRAPAGYRSGFPRSSPRNGPGGPGSLRPHREPGRRSARRRRQRHDPDTVRSGPAAKPLIGAQRRVDVHPERFPIDGCDPGGARRSPATRSARMGAARDQTAHRNPARGGRRRGRRLALRVRVPVLDVASRLLRRGQQRPDVCGRPRARRGVAHAAGAWQGDTVVADLYVITTPHRFRLVVDADAGTAVGTWNTVPLTSPDLALHLRSPLMTRPDVA